MVQSFWKQKVVTKIDMGLILMTVTEEDLKKLEPILENNNMLSRPNIKISVYKNRRGKYKGCYLWCSADLGTCRIHPQFCTAWNFEILGIEDIKIIVEDETPAWEKK